MLWKQPIPFVLFIIVGMLCLPGCQKHITAESIETPKAILVKEGESRDSACSYFYYLWGAHAEISGRYTEALQAFQKAAICDPKSITVQNKIPLLLIKNGKRDEAIEYLANQLEKDQNLVEQRLVMASLHLQDNQNDKAIALYNEVLEISPGREDVLLRMGAIYSQQGDFRQAENIFIELIENNKEPYYSHIYLARLYLQTNEYDKAIENYRVALEINWSADLIHEIASFYKITNRNEDLAQLYDDYIQSDPYDELAQYGLVEALLQIGKEDEAVNKLQAMRGYVKNPFTIDLIISKILISRNNVSEAIILLENLLESPVASEAKFLLALLNAPDDPELALSYLENIENDFKDFENAIYLQTKLLKSVDKIDKAIDIIQERLDKDDDRKPSFFSILSALYQIQNLPEKAIETLKKGTVIYPENVDLFYELALLLEQDGKTAQAIATMQEVLSVKPDHAEALNFIGYIWADNNQNLDEALKYIEKAYSINPKSGYIRDSLGWVHYRLGNLDLAREHLEEALLLEQDDPHIYEHLGDVYRDLTLYKDARNAYGAALKSASDQRQKNELQDKIDTITDR